MLEENLFDCFFVAKMQRQFRNNNAAKERNVHDEVQEKKHPQLSDWIFLFSALTILKTTMKPLGAASGLTL